MYCDYLLEFATLARAGVFTSAAEQLGMSHACLRRHMKTLESELGTTLLNRSEQGVSLTEMGRFVYTQANDIETIVAEIQKAVSQQRLTARVNVFGIGSYPRYVVSMRELCSTTVWQGAKIDLAIKPLSEPLAWWSEPCSDPTNPEASDLVFIPDGATPDSIPQGWTAIPGPRIGLVAVMEPTNPLSSRASLTRDDLEGTLVAYADSDDHVRGNMFWKCLSRQLQEAGIRLRTEARPFHSESDWFVDLGASIVIVPEAYYIVDTLRALGKVAVPLEDVDMPLVAVFRSDDKLAEHVATKATRDAF